LRAVDFDRRQALIAGFLWAQTSHKGLSLGDRAWAELDLGLDVRLIR
jgi:PIN domain nuclease of toxin-antitoxin system